MRVLHILNELRPSGAEVMLRTSASYWRDRGLDGEILATGERVGSFAGPLRAVGMQVHHLPFATSVAHFREVRRLLLAGDYQVLHIHTERASFWYGLVGLSVPGLGVVRTIHNVFSFTGCTRVKRLAQRNLLRALGVRSISVGATVADNESRRFRNPTAQLPNWVDTEGFVPPTDDARMVARTGFGVRNDTTTVIASVGNCNDAKNHRATLYALSTVGKDFDWVYLHAGEQGTDRAEERLAEDLGIADRCRFLGYVPDVFRVLHASDVYVMPSLYEGLGNAALEALATGLPCVLAASPGLRDLRSTISQGIIWIDPTPKGVCDGIRQGASLAARATPGSRVEMHAEVERSHGVPSGASLYLKMYHQVAS